MAAKDVVITLNIEAATLTGWNCPSQPQIDETVTLSDNNGGTTDNGPEQFQSKVYKDKKVKWKGHSYDPEFVVAITGIVYEGGTQMFRNPPPFAGNGTNESTIEEKLDNKSSYEGDTEVYTIIFSVSNDYKTWGPYSIDPKLKMTAPAGGGH